MALVLLYHRIADLPSDPQRLAVSVRHFAEQLEFISRRCHPMSLSSFADAARRGSLPERAVAVTFDDGYADNLERAKPLLEHHEVSATVFLTTSYLSGRREFWWDDLERILLSPGRVPTPLRLNIAGSVLECDLGEVSEYRGDDSRRHANWNIEHRSDPTARHRVYRRLCDVLRSLPAEEREAVLLELSSVAEGIPDRRSTHRTLAAAEISTLIDGGLVEVGAHTVNHPVLSALPFDDQHTEIIESKAHLEAITGQTIHAFAYPFGMPADYTEATIGLVRDAGFVSAYSAKPGPLARHSDRYNLPRLLVRDWDAVTFQAQLDRWL